MMKRIYAFGLFLTLLLGLGFNANAESWVTFEWDIPGSVVLRPGSTTGTPVELAPDQTSYRCDVQSDYIDNTLAIYAADGYTLIDAVITYADGHTETLNPVGYTPPPFINKFWGGSQDGATVKINVEKIKKNDTIEIDVVNGLNSISASFATGEVLELNNGINEIDFNEATDSPLTIIVDGANGAYKVTLNETEEIENSSTMHGEYVINVKPNDLVTVQVYENDDDEPDYYTLTINYAHGMQGCVSNIFLSGAAHSMLLPSEYEEGYITGFEAIEGQEVKLNMMSDDFTITSVKLNGTALPIENADNGIEQFVTFTLTENSTLVIDGQKTVWADITYSFYVSDAEGMAFGEAYDADGNGYDLHYTVDQTNVTGISVEGGSRPMPDTTSLIKVTVSQKNNGGKGSLFFAPKPGYFISGIYTGTGSSDNDKASTGSSVSPSDGGTGPFYVFVDKYAEPYTAHIKVASDYSSVKLKDSSQYAGIYGNPEAASMDLAYNTDEDISFIPNWSVPYTITQGNETIYVYLDGAPVDGVKDSTNDQITNFTFTPYSPAEGESSDLHSDIQVYINATAAQLPSLSGSSLTLENGATAEFYYSPIKHQANTAGQTVISGTTFTVKPTSKDAVVVYKGEPQELDSNGEFTFTATGSAAGNAVIVTAPQEIEFKGIIPSSKTKTLNKITLLLPQLEDENGGTLEADEEIISQINVTLSGTDPVATFGEFIDSAEGEFTFSLNTTLTEAETYTVRIPAGAFVEKKFDSVKDAFVAVPGGFVTKAFSARIKVDPTLKTPVEQYSLNPNGDETLDEIGTITITFPEISATSVFTNQEFPEATFTNGDKTFKGAISYDWNSEEEFRVMKITPLDEAEEPATINESGTWTLTIPEGAFQLDDDSSPEITAEYTVEGSAPAYTIAPAPGKVKSLSSIAITFNGVETIEEVEGAQITLVGPEYNAEAAEVLVASMTKIVTLKFVAPTVEGDYTLTVPAGAFTIDGKDSDEIIANYTLKTGWILSPASGQTVESLGEFMLAFPEATDVEFVGSSSSFMLTNTTSELYSCQNFDCAKVSGAEVPTFKITMAEGFNKPSNGSYRFVIDDGAFIVDGEGNAEIVAEYTLDAEINATDYILSPESAILLPQGEYEQLIVNVLFDETATVHEPADSSQINMTIDGTKIPSEAIIAMAEGNVLMIGVMDKLYYKTGTLTLSIPAGAFKIDKEDSPAITGQWEVVEPKTFEVEVQPISGNFDESTNSSSDLSVIQLFFPGAKTAKVFNEYGAFLKSAVGYTYSQPGTITVVEGPKQIRAAASEGVTVNVTFNPAPTAKGNYILEIREGALTLDGVFASPEVSQTYTLDQTTGVYEFFADENGNVTVYTLDGKVVLDKVPAAQLRELEKGLYIINGKKTLVK